MARRGTRHVNEAIRYAERCDDGRQDVCLYVKQAAKRFLSDMERKDLEFDADEVIRVIQFKQNMRHVKGPLMGELYMMNAWQKFLYAAVFGFYYLKTGRRRIREVYNEVPRKNGKSFDISTTGLYMQVADGENGAEIYCGATSEKQAKEVFNPARLIVERDRMFREHYGLEVYKKSIVRLADNALFQPVIGSPGDGPMPHMGIVDEYHEHQKNVLFKTFQTGMLGREDPILWVVTTAGDNIGGPCYVKRQEAIRVLQGVYTDPHADSMFVLIYTLDTEDLVGREGQADDWTTIKALKKANPNYNKSIAADALRRDQKQAVREAESQGGFKKKHLNIWEGAAVAFLNYEKWKLCADPDIDIEDYIGKECFMAVDLANKIDFIGKVIVFPERTEAGIIYTWFPEFWLPRAEFKKSHYDELGWEEYINVQDGVEINVMEVREKLKEDLELFAPTEIIFDPWKAAGYEQELDGVGGAELVRFNQTQGYYKSPMDELQAAHLGGRIVHPDHPVLNWMAHNLVARRDNNGNEMPNRKERGRKIDGMTAGIMAEGRALAAFDDVIDLADVKVIR